MKRQMSKQGCGIRYWQYDERTWVSEQAKGTVVHKNVLLGAPRERYRYCCAHTNPYLIADVDDWIPM